MKPLLKVSLALVGRAAGACAVAALKPRRRFGARSATERCPHELGGGRLVTDLSLMPITGKKFQIHDLKPATVTAIAFLTPVVR